MKRIQASRNRNRNRYALAALLLAASGGASALEDATELSLEDLLKAEVVTVARKSQTLQSSAAAVFIINRDDIERSGATSIPEALRLAPGVQVARISNNRWAVSVRGFNGRFSNKLLVLMDGRSIYSQLFSGVIWEAEDTLLEDIDRIEVIRGPGAAMWGANAMNGVINIITRKARDTQGGLVTAGGGDKEGGFAGVRYGGAAESGHFRLWGKAFSRDESVNLAGQEGSDDWRSARIGFRGDWTLSADRRFTLSGGAHQGKSGERWDKPDRALISVSTRITQTNEGAHLLGRHEWTHGDGSESALQAYAEASEIDVRTQLRERRQTFDLDFQHRATMARVHDLMWGVGYRYSSDEIDTRDLFRIDPERRDFRLLSAFFHDDITLIPETVRLMLGTRLEDNNITGFAPQPNVRLLWTPDANRTLWASAARAVRTPSRTERDLRADLSVIPPFDQTNPTPLPAVLRYTPRAEDALKNEKVTSYELGYRQQLGSRVSIDVAFFQADYDDLRSAYQGAVDPSNVAAGYLVQTISPDNNLKARSDGLELVLDYHATQWWRLQPSYTYLHIKGMPGAGDPISRNYATFLVNSAPRHQWSLRSSVNLPNRQLFDLWYRHTSGRDVASVNGGSVPAYSTLDFRYAWRFKPGWELSLVGQNLLENRHVEFWQDQLPAEVTQVERAWYGKIKAQF